MLVPRPRLSATFPVIPLAFALTALVVCPSRASADDDEDPAETETEQAPAPVVDRELMRRGNLEVSVGGGLMGAFAGTGLVVGLVGWATTVHCSSSFGLLDCSSTEEWWLAFPVGIALSLGVGLPILLVGRSDRKEARGAASLTPEPEVMLDVGPTGAGLDVRF
ncbi:MAG: hypothetical protein U0271_44465 [Polyangiaceae bacterium]